MSLDLTPASYSDYTSVAERHRPLFRRIASRAAVEQPAGQGASDDVAVQRTSLALAGLRNAGWSINQDIRAHRVGIPHLVIGLGGTFALETRSTSGTVRIDGDQVTIMGAGQASFTGDDWAHDARERAAEANKLLSTTLAQRVLVHAVVVVWGDFPQRRVDGHNVTFVHGEELAGWLKSRPARCGAGRVAEIEAALRQAA